LAAERLSTEDIIRAERAGVQLPVVDMGAGRMVVDLRHIYEWRELARIQGVVLPARAIEVAQ
jgi:hypothetical protein